MAKIKLTKSAVDGTPPGAGRRTPGYVGSRLLVQDYPVGPQGVHAPVPDRNAGERRKPP